MLMRTSDTLRGVFLLITIIISSIVERGNAEYCYWELLLLLLNVVTRRILIGNYYYVSLLLVNVVTLRILIENYYYY